MEPSTQEAANRESIICKQTFQKRARDDKIVQSKLFFLIEDIITLAKRVELDRR